MPPNQEPEEDDWLLREASLRKKRSADSGWRSVQWRTAEFSAKGGRVTNQDRWVSAAINRGRKLLVAVADGMGGYAGGEMASQTAAERVSGLEEDVAAARESDRIRVILPRAYREAATAISIQGTANHDWRDMGTTLAVVGAVENEYVVANVGDSRVYRFSDGQLEQLTSDHNALADAVRSNGGALPAGEAESLSHALTRVISAEKQVEVDLFPPAEGAFVAHPGDALLLTTDGLHGFVDDDEIEHVMRNASSLEEAVRYLGQLAKAKGTTDNVTVVGAVFGPWKGSGKLPDIHPKEPEEFPEERKPLARRLLLPLSLVSLILVAATAYVIWRPPATTTPASGPGKQVVGTVQGGQVQQAPPAAGGTGTHRVKGVHTAMPSKTGQISIAGQTTPRTNAGTGRIVERPRPVHMLPRVPVHRGGTGHTQGGGSPPEHRNPRLHGDSRPGNLDNPRIGGK